MKNHAKYPHAQEHLNELESAKAHQVGNHQTHVEAQHDQLDGEKKEEHQKPQKLPFKAENGRGQCPNCLEVKPRDVVLGICEQCMGAAP